MSTVYFIRGLARAVKEDLEEAIEDAQFPLRELYFEAGGFVAIFNDAQMADEEELKAFEDILKERFGNKLHVELDNDGYDGGEGMDFPAYDIDTGGGGRTVEILGIPQQYCNMKSAEDIANLVFQDYIPMQCYADEFPSPGRLTITFKGPLSRDDVGQMTDDLQVALRAKNKDWPDARVAFAQNAGAYARPAGLSRGVRPPSGRKRPRRQSERGNLVRIVLALCLVGVLIILLAYLFFGPRTFCKKVKDSHLMNLTIGQLPGVCDKELSQYPDPWKAKPDPARVATNAELGKLENQLSQCETRYRQLEKGGNMGESVSQCNDDWGKCKLDRAKLNRELEKLGRPRDPPKPNVAGGTGKKPKNPRPVGGEAGTKGQKNPGGGKKNSGDGKNNKKKSTKPGDKPGKGGPKPPTKPAVPSFKAKLGKEFCKKKHGQFIKKGMPGCL